MLIDSEELIEAIDKVRNLISVNAYCAIKERLKMIPTAKVKGDLISKEDALSCINKLYEGHTACNMFEALDAVAEYIEELPSAERVGHWVKYPKFGVYECSLCGERFRFTFKQHNYCPNCGAKMVSEDDT